MKAIEDQGVEYEDDDTSSDEEEEESKMIVYQGIEYQVNLEDNSVIDPEDYDLIGTWNEEKYEIDFENEGIRMNHERRVKG